MSALASAANILAERSGCLLLACPLSKNEVQKIGHVGFVPEPAVSNCGKTAHLFNNLVGSVQQTQRHVEAKRICRLQVDD